MKYIIILISSMTLLLFSACRKTVSKPSEEIFVKTIYSDSDMVMVSSMQLSDGGVLLIGRTLLEGSAGKIVKLNSKGEVIWTKGLSIDNRVLYDAIQLANDGFATIGYTNINSYNLVVCIYNNEGNLISTKNIPVPFTTGATIWSSTPFEIIQLKSGNFAIAGSDGINTFNGFMIITDNSFNVLHSKTFLNIGGFSGYYIRGMCEMPDSSIALTASGLYVANPTIKRTFTFLLRTKLNGTQKTLTILNDTLYSQTPNCLIEHKGGILGVTGKMQGWNSGNGIFVNYLNNDRAQLISGKIGLNVFDMDGQLIDKKLITSFPKNGMINSIKQCSDGGYILCGTVNQENTVTLMSYTNMYILKLDANLNEQWSKTIETTYPSFGVEVLQTLDGGYLLSGYQRSFNKNYEMIAIKTDANGSIK